MLAEYSPYGKFSFIIYLAKTVIHRDTIEEYSKNIHRINIKILRSPFYSNVAIWLHRRCSSVNHNYVRTAL